MRFLAGEGVRVDHGVVEGQDVSASLDPMIVWGETREGIERALVAAGALASLRYGWRLAAPEPLASMGAWRP